MFSPRFLGCKHLLMSHVQLFIHQYHQVLFHSAFLYTLIAQTAFMFGIAQALLQDTALGIMLNCIIFAWSHIKKCGLNDVVWINSGFLSIWNSALKRDIFDTVSVVGESKIISELSANC